MAENPTPQRPSVVVKVISPAITALAAATGSSSTREIDSHTDQKGCQGVGRGMRVRTIPSLVPSTPPRVRAERRDSEHLPISRQGGVPFAGRPPCLLREAGLHRRLIAKLNDLRGQPCRVCCKQTIQSMADMHIAGLNGDDGQSTPFCLDQSTSVRLVLRGGQVSVCAA
eukprot:CAMPEP_0115833806 /NCGR_PEP_ID=MMETSP0287-20121206/3360_1 /TAXON_ID=412157 /ORGANISM="Chrysochromulina rotalis, Strain UIO044" /LENGTH=168 /DNA_ID=CAMNT_0003287227 /DNA_START=309 /DNA_END=816 /DNA_ORIENTATION=-